MITSSRYKSVMFDNLSSRFASAGKNERIIGNSISRLKRSLIAKFFMVALATRCYSLAAFLLLRTVARRRTHNRQNCELWILGKEGLNQDVIAAFSRRNDIDICYFSRLCLKLLSDSRLPSAVDDNFYASTDPADEDAKLSLRTEWRKILSRLSEDARPGAILTSNFGYMYEREFAGACEEVGIPFLAFHKECFKSEGRQEFFATTYRYRGVFTGRRILVYNNIERNLLVKTGIAPLSNITVTGMPRLDGIHQWRCAGVFHQAELPPTVLVFGFTPQSGLPRLPRKPRTGVNDDQKALADEFAGLRWDSLFTNFHAAVLKLARDYPQINVIFKTKARERDGRPSVEYFYENSLPTNLHIVIGGDPADLIRKAHSVIGFNTTALCEAMAAGVPVIVPNFDEASAPKTARYVPDLGTAVLKANSPDSMVVMAAEIAMKRLTPTVQLSPIVNEQLERWVGNADGCAGARAHQAIMSEIE